MVKNMDKEKNILIIKLYLKVNIRMEKNGMEKYTIFMAIYLMKSIMDNVMLNFLLKMVIAILKDYIKMEKNMKEKNIVGTI